MPVVLEASLRRRNPRLGERLWVPSKDRSIFGLLSMSFKLNLHASHVEGYGRSV
jgi:hypothetical protein